MLIFLWLFLIGSASSLNVQDFLNELSWTLRLKLFNEMGITTTFTTSVPHSSIVTTELPASAERRINNELRTQRDIGKNRNAKLPTQRDIGKNPNAELPTHRDIGKNQYAELLTQRDIGKNQNAELPTRRDMSRNVGIQALVLRRQIDEQSTVVAPPDTISADENNMRLKLFRLMYETVRDSDLKVKRAELIQEHYTNLTSFQIGYLMGDVTDKYTIMTDISSTLTRFYSEWKPIEHINAYEQIANQAIEIGHLIDMMRLTSKKEVTQTPKY